MCAILVLSLLQITEIYLSIIYLSILALSFKENRCSCFQENLKKLVEKTVSKFKFLVQLYGTRRPHSGLSKI